MTQKNLVAAITRIQKEIDHASANFREIRFRDSADLDVVMAAARHANQVIQAAQYVVDDQAYLGEVRLGTVEGLKYVLDGGKIMGDTKNQQAIDWLKKTADLIGQFSLPDQYIETLITAATEATKQSGAHDQINAAEAMNILSSHISRLEAEAARLRYEVPEWLPMDKFFAGNSPYYGGSVDLLLNGNVRIPDCYFCYESKEFLMCGTDVPVVLDGDPINKITHWVKPLPLPAPPKSTAQAESDKTRKPCGHPAEHFDDTDDYGQVVHDEPLNKG